MKINWRATGRNVRAIIKDMILSVDVIARKMNLSTPMLRQRLTGERKMTVDQLVKLSLIIDTQIEDFVVMDYEGEGERFYNKNVFYREDTKGEGK